MAEVGLLPIARIILQVCRQYSRATEPDSASTNLRSHNLNLTLF